MQSVSQPLAGADVMGADNPREATERAANRMVGDWADAHGMPRVSFTPRSVEPTGSSAGLALVCRTGSSTIRRVMSAVYPPSPRGKALRELRVNEGPFMSMCNVGRLLGLSAVQVSSLESGSATLDEPEWDRLFAEVRAAKERQP